MIIIKRKSNSIYFINFACVISFRTLRENCHTWIDKQHRKIMRHNYTCLMHPIHTKKKYLNFLSIEKQNNFQHEIKKKMCKIFSWRKASQSLLDNFIFHRYLIDYWQIRNYWYVRKGFVYRVYVSFQEAVEEITAILP